MTYTEYDAVYEIVFWQFFVSLVVAVLGIVHNIPYPTRWHLALSILPTVVGFFCLCWFTTFMLFVCLDMLMLPPLFSLVRLVSSDALLS
jgi:hypothetical protein